MARMRSKKPESEPSKIERFQATHCIEANRKYGQSVIDSLNENYFPGGVLDARKQATEPTISAHMNEEFLSLAYTEPRGGTYANLVPLNAGTVTFQNIVKDIYKHFNELWSRMAPVELTEKEEKQIQELQEKLNKYKETQEMPKDIEKSYGRYLPTNPQYIVHPKPSGKVLGPLQNQDSGQ